MTEQEMAIQKLTEMVTKLETENAELKSNFEKSINKVEEKFSAQIKESNKLTEDVLELVKTLVAEPTQHQFNTQSKPKSYIDGLVANLKYSQTKIK
jgi:DNA anti-recombination protein RmuC